MPYLDEFRRQRRYPGEDSSIHDCLEADCTVNPLGELITAPKQARFDDPKDYWLQTPFTWEYVHHELMLDWPTPLQYSPDEITEYLNLVSDTLGSDWIAQRTGLRGVVVVLDLVKIGRTLSFLRKGLPATAPLLGRLLSNKGRLFEATLAEAQIAADLLEHGCVVEVEPVISIDGKVKRPDIRFKTNDMWTYLEVTRPEMPNAMKKASEWGNQLFNLFDGVVKVGSLQVYLSKEPSPDEVSELTRIVTELCNAKVTRCVKIPQLGYVAYAETRLEVEQLRETYRESKHTLRILSPGRNRYIGIDIKYVDRRTERVINEKRNQLPEHERSILVINCTNLQGELKTWTIYSERLLEQDDNKRIGAIILYSKTIIGGTVETQIRAIKNRQAHSPIPDDILNVFGITI